MQKLALVEHPKPLGYDGQSAYAQASEDIVWSYFLEGNYGEAVNTAKSYKPDEKHFSVNAILLGYFSLLRLGRQEPAEALLNEKIANFRGPAEEHVLLLDAQGRVSEGFPYLGLKEMYSDVRSEGLQRASFFGGLRDIAIGRPDMARFHLGDAASDPGDSVVALAARIELERLGPKPKN